MHMTLRDIDAAKPGEEVYMAHRNAIAGSIGGITLAASMALSAAGAWATEQSGRVMSGDLPVSYAAVQLFRAGEGGASRAVMLGQDRADAAGNFRITYDEPSGEAVLYLVASGGAVGNSARTQASGPIRMAAALGTSPVPPDVVINERTTVALAYAFAQFLDDRSISGVAPGPKNAALTAHNLADIGTGNIADLLAGPPNGNETQTLREFNSLANLLAGCVSHSGRCSRLFALATPPGGPVPTDTLQAALNIAHFPGQNAGALFRLSNVAKAYHPVLPKAPDTWTLALLYDGGGGMLDGPGNMVFDADGNVWIGNNYKFKASAFTSTCGDNHVIRLTPDGRNYPGAPYVGGGVKGVGFGVAMDPDGNVWLGNFGFKGKGCTQNTKDNSVSKFNGDGEAQSPEKGFTQGDVDRPQGMASDDKGTIWIANCGGDSVTRYPNGDPDLAENRALPGLKKPFGVAVDGNRNAWFTANTTNRVFKFDPDGNLLFRTARNAGGVKRPMGVAVDSLNNAWVANSGVMIAPCYRGESLNIPNPKKESVTMISPDGTTSGPYESDALFIPWGIAVDGNDNIWVANFGGHNVVQFCGARPQNCPPGFKTGDPISPPTGYRFDGLTRVTAVQIDSSGNVWLANNWLNVPIQTNPGGKTMVVFVGMASPVKTPVIGPPQRP